MPDLANFSNRIGRVGDDVEDGTDRVVRQAAVAVNQTVTLSTPVRHGPGPGQIGRWASALRCWRRRKTQTKMEMLQLTETTVKLP